MLREKANQGMFAQAETADAAATPKPKYQVTFIGGFGKGTSLLLNIDCLSFLLDSHFGLVGDKKGFMGRP